MAIDLRSAEKKVIGELRNHPAPSLKIIRRMQKLLWRKAQ